MFASYHSNVEQVLAILFYNIINFVFELNLKWVPINDFFFNHCINNTVC